MQSAAASKTRWVLLVEDNDGDAVLAREAFKDASAAVFVQRVANGADALAFLHRKGKFFNAERPDLILLDLNMPRMNGREVLAHLKADVGLCTIPVIVLTTSQADRDVLDSYTLHANCYISKPIAFKDFSTIVKKLTEFWFEVVRLPH